MAADVTLCSVCKELPSAVLLLEIAANCYCLLFWSTRYSHCIHGPVLPAVSYTQTSVQHCYYLHCWLKSEQTTLSHILRSYLFCFKMMRQNNDATSSPWLDTVKGAYNCTALAVKWADLHFCYCICAVKRQQSVRGLKNNNNVSFTFAGIWRLMHSNGLSHLSILKSHTSFWEVGISQRESSLSPALKSGH